MTWQTRSMRSAGKALRAVVDTNVWASGLINPGGAPGRVLEGVRRRQFVCVVTWPLLQEINEVLSRPGLLRRYQLDPADVHELLQLLEPLLAGVELAVDLRDAQDLPVLEAALVGNADVVVTGDRRLREDPAALRLLASAGVEMMTPAAFVTRLA